jgi:hypothetical protein
MTGMMKGQSMTDDPAEDQKSTWMLDLDPDGWPVLAHEIATVERGNTGEARITACGQRATAATHPRGWWSTPRGELPLSGEGDIHCWVSR